MITRENWKKFLTDNKWIILAAAFFILWKFFLIYSLWDDRHIPPGPDDSYIYILHIDSTLRCDNFLSCQERAFAFDTYGGFDHLSYRIFLGTIGKILGLDATATYHLSFYLGTLLLIPALIFFLLRLDSRAKGLVAFSLFTLALYNGSGSYHGFFWVVPSFFVFLIFLIILGILLDDTIQRWYHWFFLLLPLAIYTHVLGLYFLAVLPIFFILYSLLTRTFHKLLLKKILFLFGVAIAVYVPVGIYFSEFSYGNPYGPEVIAKNIISQKITVINEGQQTGVTTKESKDVHPFFTLDRAHIEAALPGWGKITSDYFRWIFPSFIGYIIFFYCFFFLLSQKYYKLIALYLASFFFVIASATSIHGERSLILIWPLTFLLYAQAGWLTLRLIHENITPDWYRFLLKICIIITIISAVVITSMYSYLWNSYLNQVRNILITPELTRYLKQEAFPYKLIAYSNDMNFLDAFMMLEYGSEKPGKTIELPTASKYVTLEKEERVADIISYESTFQRFFHLVRQVLLFEKEKPNPFVPDHHPSLPNLHFTKEAQFEKVEVYRIENHQ